ncbi:hypothetical protein LBMAG52_05210 [Planctomycetia bacterium]|nr:hypothetical protein LBMAG52_05210 [Planctomycetia bacterium]
MAEFLGAHSSSSEVLIEQIEDVNFSGQPQPFDCGEIASQLPPDIAHQVFDLRNLQIDRIRLIGRKPARSTDHAPLDALPTSQAIAANQAQDENLNGRGEMSERRVPQAPASLQDVTGSYLSGDVRADEFNLETKIGPFVSIHHERRRLITDRR